MSLYIKHMSRTEYAAVDEVEDEPLDSSPDEKTASRVV